MALTTLERAKRFSEAIERRLAGIEYIVWLPRNIRYDEEVIYAFQKRARAYRALLKKRIQELPQNVMEDKYQVDCFVRWGLEQALELFDAIHSHNTAS